MRTNRDLTFSKWSTLTPVNKWIGLLFLLCSVANSYGSSGTEGAAFLEIPVGARPAAFGSAYSALATDAYAPIYNPGALGFIRSDQLTAMHLSYLDSVDYEYAGYVHPFSPRDAIGASGQLLLPGSINGTDINGNSIGSVSGHYGAYSVSYAHTFEDIAVGITGKWINAAIGDAGANAFATDMGALYKANDQLSLAAVAANLGGKLTFVSQADDLPTELRLGAAYSLMRKWIVSIETGYQTEGLFVVRGGVEWTPTPFLSLRVGYRTDTTDNLSALAGFTTGLGLHLWGQELDYAWLPLGDLGNTQYVSLTIRFGKGTQTTNLQRAPKTNSYYNDLSKDDVE